MGSGLLKIPGSTGVWKKNSGDAFKEYACSHPVIITERLCNIDTETEKLTLAFLKDDKWQTLIVERSTLASRTKVIELADRGIAVNSENAKAFIRYLADLESLNLDKIPAYQSIDRMGWIGILSRFRLSRSARYRIRLWRFQS